MKLINGKFGESQENTKKSFGESFKAAVKDLGVDEITDGHFMILISTNDGFSVTTSQLNPPQTGFMLDMAKHLIIGSALETGPEFNEEA